MFKKGKVFKLLIAFSLLISCSEPGFYDHMNRGDLYRIPLIEPYELTTTIDDDDSLWFFKVQGFHPFLKISPEDEGKRIPSYEMSGADKVAIHKSFLLVHSYDSVSRKGNMPAWLVINLKTDEKMIFYYKENRKEFVEAMKTMGFKGFNPIGISKLKEGFFYSSKLPERWFQYRRLGKNLSSGNK